MRPNNCASVKDDRAVWGVFTKCAIVSGCCSLAFGMLGFYGPLLFHRDVGGALAASVLEIVGLVSSGLLLSAGGLTDCAAGPQLFNFEIFEVPTLQI
jgi:hypothetical protein